MREGMREAGRAAMAAAALNAGMETDALAEKPPLGFGVDGINYVYEEEKNQDVLHEIQEKIDSGDWHFVVNQEFTSQMIESSPSDEVLSLVHEQGFLLVPGGLISIQDNMRSGVRWDLIVSDRENLLRSMATGVTMEADGDVLRISIHNMLSGMDGNGYIEVINFKKGKVISSNTYVPRRDTDKGENDR